MKQHLMTPEEVRAALAPLSYAQIGDLSDASGVPLTTLWKIKIGETTDPRIGTVGQFMPFVKEVMKQAA